MSDQVTEIVIDQDQEIGSIRSSDKSTSEKIRKLSALGVTRPEISKILNIRYQHVRNVLITPVKRQS
jgi:hypothetical protein